MGEAFFKEADANSDGFLDEAEIPKLVELLKTEKTAEQKAQEAAKILMADHDTDKDGKLSLAEIVDDREDNKEENEIYFAEADANKDGKLSLVEIVDYRDNEMEEVSKFFKEADANSD